MMNEKIIFVFPGQGAQYVGMCKELFNEFAAVRHTFEEVSDISHRNIANICFEGPREDLNKPENTSLGTFAHSVSIARLIEEKLDTPLYEIAYAIVGHSMGQYSALHCVGSVSMEDAVHLLSARSSYMSMTNQAGGGMACIVGLSKEDVERSLMAATGHGYAAIANHNARDQFIISGQNEALDAVIARAREKGARIARRLNVAIPAHCALMQNAEILLRKRLENINIEPPKTNWFSNQTANVMVKPLDVKESLADQMTHGVRWLEIMEKFPVYNITRAYELGPGKALTGLINRANVGCFASATDNIKNVKDMLNELEQQKSR